MRAGNGDGSPIIYPTAWGHLGGGPRLMPTRGEVGAMLHAPIDPAVGVHIVRESDRHSIVERHGHGTDVMLGEQSLRLGVGERSGADANRHRPWISPF